MCKTWYLSMPVGTIFVFRVNARATLKHLLDAELEEQLVAEDAKARLMVGYVRDVSPAGLDIGLLVSEAQAYDGSSSMDPFNPIIRKGVAVHSDNIPECVSSRPRRQTHPLFDPPTTLFGKASSNNTVTSIIALPPLQSQLFRKREGLISALTNSALALRPTEPLPWNRAFAFRPHLGFKPRSKPRGQDDTGALRVPLGACHRLVVGAYSAAGVAARPQTRFSRKEVARAEHVMDGLREEEEEERRERTKERELFGHAPLTIRTLYSNNIEDGNSSDCSTVVSERSIASVAGKASSRPLPIVIDIFLDLTKVKSLPSSPEEFEKTVARLDSMERAVRRRMADSIDEWTGLLKKDGHKWKTE